MANVRTYVKEHKGHQISVEVRSSDFLVQCKGVDFWENNEAFATQVLACVAAWQDKNYCRDELRKRGAIGEINQDTLNVDGGGISIGHPVGASGARIVLHLLKVLERNNSKTGMASLCIGGGQGGAMLVVRES